MAASISQYMGAVPDQISVRNLTVLLGSILIDLNAIRTQLNVHQHSALSAAPTTTLPALNTTT